MDRKQRLGARIREARLALDLSQAELADAVGMTVESISRAERGAITPTIWTLLEMCRALDIDIGTLIGETQEERARSPKIERAIRLMTRISEEEIDPILDLLEILERKKRKKR